MRPMLEHELRRFQLLVMLTKVILYALPIFLVMAGIILGSPLLAVIGVVVAVQNFLALVVIRHWE